LYFLRLFLTKARKNGILKNVLGNTASKLPGKPAGKAGWNEL
jgi:hypothetical protein